MAVKNYRYLFFDLDGTLLKSGEGIQRCAQHALRHFGINIEDLEKLRPFVGPPLEDSFKDFYHLQPNRHTKRQEYTVNVMPDWELMKQNPMKVYSNFCNI